MSKMTLDPEFHSRLNGLKGHVEFCTEDGTIVGHFLPDDFYRRLVHAWANAQVTDEELDGASREPGGRTLQEILHTLEQP
jgi:hypothetical protein